MKHEKNFQDHGIEQPSLALQVQQQGPVDDEIAAHQDNVLSSLLVLEELVDLSNTYVPDGCQGNLD